MLSKRPLEWRQPEWVSAVLHAEDAEEKRVHDQHDASPDDDGDRLRAWVGHAWDLEGQADGGEGKDAV